MSYNNKKDIKSIVSFLCSDSGSHDYTISRTEARRLGLNVKSPSQEIYEGMKNWFEDISQELELKNPYDPVKIIGSSTQTNYLFKRCLIESVDYGEDAYISEGILRKSQVTQNGITQSIINNNRIFEGWRHA